MLAHCPSVTTCMRPRYIFSCLSILALRPRR